MHPIARLARFSVTHVVRKDNEIPVGIEGLTGPKQHIGKLRCQELPSGAAGTVQDQHSVGYFPVAIPFCFAESRIVQPEFGESFARLEMEVVTYIIAFLGR
jgi:hypothetical protein